MSDDDTPVAAALRVAADLKSAAAQAGDEDPAARSKRFSEILQNAEKTLAPQQHPEFYKALARWFPSAPQSDDVNAAPQPSAAPEQSDSAPLRTPDAIVAAIKAVIPTLSYKDRLALAMKLSPLLPMRTSPAPSATPAASGALTLAPETLKMLSVPLDAPVDVNRLAPLMGLLIEVLVRLDDTAWGVWESFGTDAKGLRREVVMKKALAALLTGQAKLTIPQLQMQIAQVQRLTVELLAQTKDVGAYALKHASKMSPHALAQAEEIEGQRFVVRSLAARCWERYSQGWATIESSMQTAVNKEIARSVSGAVNGQRF